LITCREASELITAYVDDELSPEDAGMLIEHLNGCWPCRERLVFEQELRVALRHNHVPAQCPERLRRRIIEAVNAQTRPSGRRAWLLLALLLMALLIALLPALYQAIGLQPARQAGPQAAVECTQEGPTGHAVADETF